MVANSDFNLAAYAERVAEMAGTFPVTSISVEVTDRLLNGLIGKVEHSTALTRMSCAPPSRGGVHHLFPSL